MRARGLAAVVATALIAPLFGTAPGTGQTLPPHDPTVTPVWRTRQATVGTPAVEGHEVFGLTADHQLFKLSAEDGSERWRVGTGERGVTYGHALALTSSLVLVGEYDLAAFDRVTGRWRWSYAPAIGYAPGPYLGDLVDGVAYAGSAAGYLHAVEAETGRALWSARVLPSDEATVYRPRVANETVVAGFTVHGAPGRGGLLAVNRTDGRLRWRFDFPAADLSTQMAGGPIVTGELAIGASTDGRIFAVDRQSGALRWTLPPMSGPLDSIITAGDQDYRALGLSGHTLFAGSTTGYVVAYDVRTQEELWRFAGGLLGSTAFSVTTAGDLAIVPYVSGFLVALDVRTGQPRWRTYDWQHGFVWPPAVAGQVLMAASRSGVWALHSYAGESP